MTKKSIDEVIDKCGRCGLCLSVCPIYHQLILERYSPRGKVQLAKFYEKGDLELTDAFRETFSKCLLCGACRQACANGIDLNGVVEQMRQAIVREKGLAPKEKAWVENLLQHHNIAGEDNEERGDWREFLDGMPEHGYQKARAEVVYFVGCVSSFYPMAQKIPQNMVRIMVAAQVDFSILGGEEHCCGFPLLGAGLPEKAEACIQHNLQAVDKMGAEKLVFSCPSCYWTWKEHYDTDIRIAHTTQFIHSLITEGKLKFKDIGKKEVTYHDPCDLGRKGGIFDLPRRIIESIPSLTLIEMANTRMNSMCCGGGGNLETSDGDLAGLIAQKRINEIRQTGADLVVSSCQQCVRTIATRARRQKLDLEVMDITELVCQALNP